MDLFSSYLEQNNEKPLPLKMRPTSITEIVGQESLIHNNALLNFLNPESYHRPSAILLYGPSGSGKTSIALTLQNNPKINFINTNAANLSLKDIRVIQEDAIKAKTYHLKDTYLFIDEIHRFNKSQIDSLLSIIENRDLFLICATTENPYAVFSKAFLSRILVLKTVPLSSSEIELILERAITIYFPDIPTDKECITYLASASKGDARKALILLEQVVINSNNGVLNEDYIKKIIDEEGVVFDQTLHYDLASALIKSIRGSDPDAAIYYLALAIKSGEDLSFILRRLIILAAEDVGIADPTALKFALDTKEGVEAIGLPEGRILLANLVIYLALTDKSNSAYLAIDKALSQDLTNTSIPTNIKHSTKNYLYPHDFPNNYVSQRYLPEHITEKFYTPSNSQLENDLYAKYLARINPSDVKEGQEND